MTNPITPPPELVHRWALEAEDEHQPTVAYSLVGQIAAKAAQWGANQELETILEMVGVGQQSLPEEDRYLDGFTVASIRAARRPKPPSLKQQALEALNSLSTPTGLKTANRFDTIRRALEALPND